MLATGFPKKDARILKLKNFPDIIGDDREGQIIEITTLNILACEEWSEGRDQFWTCPIHI